MYKKYTISILCVFILTTLFLDESYAQERSIGATFSYGGSGLEYVSYIDSKHFAQYQMRVETMSLFWSGQGKMGISASGFWNTVFANIESRNGNDVRFFAGPGIAIGYSEDITQPAGLIFGLKGRVGAECRFPRGITIALSISPMLGGHFTSEDGMIKMRLYRTGLCYGLMPEAGIRYCF